MKDEVPAAVTPCRGADGHLVLSFSPEEMGLVKEGLEALKENESDTADHWRGAAIRGDFNAKMVYGDASTRRDACERLLERLRGMRAIGSDPASPERTATATPGQGSEVTA